MSETEEHEKRWPEDVNHNSEWKSVNSTNDLMCSSNALYDKRLGVFSCSHDGVTRIVTYPSSINNQKNGQSIERIFFFYRHWTMGCLGLLHGQGEVDGKWKWMVTGTTLRNKKPKLGILRKMEKILSFEIFLYETVEGWRCSSVVESLPSMDKSLGLTLAL
jgi:hypothetical protein